MMSIFAKFLTFLCTLICLAAYQDDHHILYGVDELKVNVETDSIINVVDKHFLSFCIDSYVFQPDVHWLEFNFSSPRLHTLLTALSPAILRVGGSPADWLFFNTPFNILNATQLKPTAIVITKQDLVNLVHLTRSTQNRLLFDLNLDLRYGDQWDPSNAIELFEFCSEMGFGDNMDWELGNEPSGLAPGVITAQRVGDDFVLLRRLVQQYPNMVKSSIVGPDIVDLGQTGLEYLQCVANSSGSFLKAVTFHQYYFRGDVVTYKEYLNPNNFAHLAEAINRVKDAVKRTKYPKIPIWIGETSDAWHSGTVNVSDRFVSGFLWMDKLGLSAQMGLGVVMRQTFYGHNYALLDIDMQPNPDFWLSWLHKVLVGQKVFSIKTGLISSNSTQTTRVYAHCTNTGPMYSHGAVTAFALNIDPNKATTLSFQGKLAGQEIDAYLLEPDEASYNPSVLSKWTKLNGKRLQMASDTTMPTLVPDKILPSDKVLLPPLTLGYFVFPNVQIKSCL